MLSTNAELIAEAKRDHPYCQASYCPMTQLADALEASDAQVARFKKIVRHYRDAKVMADETAWPADLLEAVHLAVGPCHRVHNPYSAEYEAADEEARAVLVRYGLLKEAR